MASFRFVVSSGSRSFQLEKDQNECASLFGKKIGDSFSGDLIGLSGYELKIAGGSDTDGFPMRSDIDAMSRKRLIVAKSKGFSGTRKIRKKKVRPEGYRKRKSIRGNTVSNSIAQINCAVAKPGQKSLEELLGKPAKEEKQEQSAEKSSPAPPEKKE